jgi:hypothetical protein
MNSVLAVTSTLLWWVLYSSMAALVFALSVAAQRRSRSAPRGGFEFAPAALRLS